MAADIGVWLDCDPGHDDALAIILAAHGDALKEKGGRSIELLGISTVHGNQTVDKTTRNALAIHYLAALSPSVPVVQGAARGLMRDVTGCEEIHGVTGLDTTGPSKDFMPSDETLQEYSDDNGGILANASLSHRGLIDDCEPAVTLMYRAIRDHKKPVVLVCTGACTNAALLLSVYPQVKQHIEQVVLMGGAIGMGNTSPCAEWNIQIDPEAAKMVFTSGIAVVQVPLETTHTVLVTESILERISSIEANGSELPQLICGLLTFFAKTYKEQFEFESPPLHDPLTIAYLLAPDLFTTRHLNVEIETSSVLSPGQTVTDYFGTTGRQPNTTVCLKSLSHDLPSIAVRSCRAYLLLTEMQVDVEQFWDMMIGAVERASIASPM